MSPATQIREKTARRNRAHAPRPAATAGPAVAALHLLSDAELRRIAEKIFKLSDADETEVEIGVVSDALTRFANNTIHQNVAEQVLTVSVRTVLDGRTARATTNKTDDDSLRRVVAASKALARSQPRIPGLLPMPGPQKYGKVCALFREHGARHAGGPRSRRRPRGGTGRKEQADRRGHFHHGRDAIGDCEYEGPFRFASPDARRIFHHHSGIRFLRLGQGQFARSRPHRSGRPGSQRQRKSRRLAQSGRSRAGPLDGDSRACRGARSGGFPFLRFCRDGGDGPALVLQQAHGQESHGRKHHAPRRRVSPAAVGRALRRRRHSAAESAAGR